MSKRERRRAQSTLPPLPSEQAVIDHSESGEEQTMRVVTFDEDGAHDLGHVDVGQLHEIVGAAVGELVSDETAVLVTSAVDYGSEPERIDLVQDTQASSAQPEHGQPESTAPSPATESAAGSAGVRTRSRRYTDQAVVWVLVAKNPKRPGTAGWERFECYVSGKTTVADYRKQRVVGKFCAPDISWDLQRGFIALQEPGEPVPEGAVLRTEDDGAQATV